MAWEGLLLSASFCTNRKLEAQKGHSTLRRADECPPGAETDPQPQVLCILAHVSQPVDGHPDTPMRQEEEGQGWAQATRDAVSAACSAIHREGGSGTVK